MTTTVLHHDDYAQSRWKNGLGVTRTVDIAPEGADFDTFAWRVSMADVGEPTPFSPLPGVDRWLMPVAGSGFELTINGASYRPARGEVVRFSGDDEASGGASGSGSRDLNLMVRRPHAAADLRTLAIAANASLDARTLAAHGGTMLAILLDGDAQVDGISLSRFDAVHLTENACETFETAAGCLLAIASLAGAAVSAELAG
jgi:environmental stress-induced protein Ves